MVLEYKTKRDINGNMYYLYINLDTKTIISGYGLHGYYDISVVVSKSELHNIQEQFEAHGFTTDYI